jgi:hypothetical protein
MVAGGRTIDFLLGQLAEIAVLIPLRQVSPNTYQSAVRKRHLPSPLIAADNWSVLCADWRRCDACPRLCLMVNPRTSRDGEQMAS